MSEALDEIPRVLAATLRKLGPIHEAVQSGYYWRLYVVLKDAESHAGFLLEQRLAEAATPAAAEGTGFSFAVPRKADPASEAVYLFTESLAAAWSFLSQAAD